MSGVYDGTLNPAKTEITGTWTQSSVQQKLDFRRSDQLLELIRPQNPTKPYPYREEEILFANASAKISLAGTLTLPPGKGPFPAAILLSGSGPHDRDESLVGHRPFLVLADHLTRRGIAVLRFDKRGIGKSTGDYTNATTADFASDAEAVLAYLKTRKEIDPKKIGLIGHSEGGMIAPMVATRSNDVAWIVLLAGPALKGEDTLLLQSELILRTAGVNDGQIAKTREFNKQTYVLVRQEKDPAALEAKLNALVQSSGMSASLPPAALQAQVRLMVSPWFRFFLDYDPVPALRKTMCPVLALNGEKDLQIAPKENLRIEGIVGITRTAESVNFGAIGTERKLGDEIDAKVTWALTKQASLHFGIGFLFDSKILEDSMDAAGASASKSKTRAIEYVLGADLKF